MYINFPYKMKISMKEYLEQNKVKNDREAQPNCCIKTFEVHEQFKENRNCHKRRL